MRERWTMDGAGTAAPSDPARLMTCAIAGVLRNAQEGELPLFATTLGLPQSGLLKMMRQLFPEPESPEQMPERDYALIRDTAPPEFDQLATMLFANRTAGTSVQQAVWLSHGIAAACLGDGHLWQDLGLSGREAVSSMLAYYFAPLYRRNVHDLKWKHFLYRELGLLLGTPDLQAPGCRHCGQFDDCFKKN